jgi:hypothetical protein
MKLRSLLMVCLGSTFVSVAIWLYLWFVVARHGQHPGWLTFVLGVLIFPGHFLMFHILPWQYTVMSCPGCEPAHKDLVVVVVAVVLNIAFWTTLIFVGSVLFRFTRRLFSRGSSNQAMERTAGSFDS